MAVLLPSSNLFLRRNIVSVEKEGSNDSIPINMVNCRRNHTKRVSCHSGKSGASAIDTALEGLYCRIEMTSDSQLEGKPSDSQLEPGGLEAKAEDIPSSARMWQKAGEATTLTYMSEHVPQVPTFPDMSNKHPQALLYGYYLPQRNLMVGHRAHALTCRFIWTRRFRGMVPQPLDGVAMWTLPTGHNVIRVVVRDFFTGKYTVLDRFPTARGLVG